MNLAQMFSSICAKFNFRKGQSSRSKPPCSKSSNHTSSAVVKDYFHHIWQICKYVSQSESLMQPTKPVMLHFKGERADRKCGIRKKTNKRKINSSHFTRTHRAHLSCTSRALFDSAMVHCMRYCTCNQLTRA